MDNYTLIGQTAVPEPDLLTAARWFETADRRVAETFLPNGARVSTVFLCFDHNYSDAGPPLIFETMVFWQFGDGPELTDRYSTWPEAEAGHRAIVREAMSPAYWLAAIYATAQQTFREMKQDLVELYEDLFNIPQSPLALSLRRMRELRR